MNNCFRCGASGGDKKLFDAISGKGIVRICEDCASVEGYPLVKKPVEEVEDTKQKSVRDRLIGMNKRFNYGKEPTLRDLIDEKYKAKNPQVHSDLAENFHWTIQRIRRVRRITREQFSKGIDEPESVVRMIESGFLPEDNYKVIAKVEKFLGVSLRKGSGLPSSDEKKFILDNSLVEKELLDEEPKRLGFDFNSVSKLKIGDLKKMDEKTEKPEKKKFGFWNRKKAEPEEPKEDEKSADWEEEYNEEDLKE